MNFAGCLIDCIGYESFWPRSAGGDDDGSDAGLDQVAEAQQVRLGPKQGFDFRPPQGRLKPRGVVHPFQEEKPWV